MTVTLDLPDSLEHSLSERARQEGVSTQGWVEAVVKRELDSKPACDEASDDSRPIWEIIEERMKKLPAEAFEGAPEDGAAEHDHYLYGSPKKYS